MALDTGGNVKVDFVWGHTPMQPDDVRDGDGALLVVAANADQNKGWSGYSVYPSEALDATLGDHINAATSYNGFPNYDHEFPYLDTVANATVPNVVGLTESAANTALVAADLVKGAVTTTTAGAVFVIDQGTKVDTTNVVTVRTTAAHGISVGDSVSVTLSTTGWTNLGGTVTVTAVTSTTFSFVDSDVAADVTDATIAGTVVRTALVGKVKTQNPAAAAVVNAGDAVALVKYAAS